MKYGEPDELKEQNMLYLRINACSSTKPSKIYIQIQRICLTVLMAKCATCEPR